jgi:hypothetical protein
MRATFGGVWRGLEGGFAHPRAAREQTSLLETLRLSGERGSLCKVPGCHARLFCFQNVASGFSSVAQGWAFSPKGVGGPRVWILPGSRQGSAPLQHRPSHSPPAVARPLSSLHQPKLTPRWGIPCIRHCLAGAPGARSRPGCAQALHTAGAWPASLKLCLAFLGVDGPKHAGEWGTG